MFNLNYIEVQNFLSFGNNPTKIDFNDYGSILFQGKNGQGKSVLAVEAVYFGLFGRPYRNNLKLGDIVNNVNNKEMLVRISINKDSDEYIIERGLKPNIFNFFKNGEKIENNHSKLDFQNEINNKLGLNPKIFNQLVLVDNTFHTPFMELPIHEKRNIIDKLFELDDLTNMKTKLLDTKIKINNDISKFEFDHELLSEKIKIRTVYNKEKIEKQLSEIDNEISSKDKIVKEIKSSIQNHIIKIKELSESKKKVMDKIKSKNDEIRDEDKSGDYRYSIKHINSEIKLLKSGKCPKCSSILKYDDKKKSEYDDKIKKINNDIKKNDIKIKKLQDEISILNIDDNKIQDDYHSISMTKSEEEGRLKSIEKSIKSLNKKKKDISSELEEDDNEQLKKLNNDLLEINKKLNKKNHILSKLNLIENVLSDKGVRSYLLSYYIPILNKLISKYLALFETPFGFQLNSTLEQEIDPDLRNSISYAGLSLGQKFRVNFSILFSMMEFSENKHNTRFNFFILDEMLENGADDEAKEVVIDILNNKINKKIYLISHDSNLQNYFKTVFKFYKKGSFSEVEITNG